MGKEFCQKIGNVKAIAERGWGPALNQNLLDDSEIARTMTSNDMLEEQTLSYGNIYLVHNVEIQTNNPSENNITMAHTKYDNYPF